MLSYIETGFCNNQVEFISPLQTPRDASHVEVIIPMDNTVPQPIIPFQSFFLIRSEDMLFQQLFYVGIITSPASFVSMATMPIEISTHVCSEWSSALSVTSSQMS